MARERYLINAGEDTIHANEIRAETPADKRKNWWYYHKGHLAIGLVAFAVLFSIFYSIFSKVQPDYTVGLITSYTMPESGRKELERCLTEYADDRNGDGKVVVAVTAYVFSSDMPNSPDALQQQQAAIARFAGDILANESMIFLHNEEAFDFMIEDFSGFYLYNDGTPMPDTATDYENAMLPWKEIEAFSTFTPQTEESDTFNGEMLTQLYEDLRVSVRAAEGTAIAKKEKDMKYYEDSLDFYQRLLTGEKPSAAGEQ